MLPSNSLFERAVTLHRAGNVTVAESLYRQHLTAHPSDGAAAYHLSTICFTSGRHHEALDMLEIASRQNINEIQVLTMKGLNLQSIDRHAEALAQYDRAIASQPDNTVVLCNRGYVLAQLDRPAEALDCFDKALTLSPNMAPALGNRGAVLLTLGRAHEALQNLDQLVALNFQSIEIDLNRAEALRRLGRIPDSRILFQKILTVHPRHAQALYGLGNTLFEEGDFEAAANYYRQALSSNPAFSEAQLAYGNSCRVLNLRADAEAAFTAALSSSRVGPAARDSLALLLLAENRPNKALEIIIPALGDIPAAAAGTIFAACMRAPGIHFSDKQLPRIMIRALSEGWARPSDIADAAAAILLADPDIGPILRDPEIVEFSDSQIELFDRNALLIALLTATANTDPTIETFIREARLALLRRAESLEESHSIFFAALATQCFINEYVISRDEPENLHASQQRAILERNLASHGIVPAALLLSVAAYFPLISIKNAECLLQQSWPEPIASVLNLQLRNIFVERELTTSIARLTPITAAISLKVGAQYEESPYPRWVSAGSAASYPGVATYLKNKFPGARISAQDETKDIMVAGCGTGQHAMITAQRFPKSRILGIGLSLASLTYANRKANELGLKNLEFAQADILELNRTDRRFDVIEAVGVLHHLGDPFAGWTKLLDLLHPGGFMMVGLYSAIARHEVALVKEKFGCSSDANGDEIRRVRGEILRDREHPLYRRIILSPDFFSFSSCRDLLFHAHEEFLNLPMIARFLKEKGLAFIGFEQDEEILSAYQHAYPADPYGSNLNNWHNFELLNQNAFAGMYRFWIQKPQ